jgi:hypothetical protein
MKEKLKYWWWRFWTFRKEKIRLTFHNVQPSLGEVFFYSATIKSNPSQIIHIGKNYFIPYKLGILDLR